MSTFTLEIVTPDRKFFEDEVEMIIVRGTEGDLGIYKNHSPLVTSLAIGRIKIKQNGKFVEAAIAGGYIEVDREKSTIVTDSAEWPEEIDVERAKEAKKRAEERLKHKSKSEVDLIRAEVALRKAVNRLDVVDRYRK